MSKRNLLRPWDYQSIDPQYKRNRKNIFSSLLYRLLYLVLIIAIIILLLYGLSYLLQTSKGGAASQVVVLGFFLVFLFPFVLYALRSFNQISEELSLNGSIHSVRKEINLVRLGLKDFRTIQPKINNLRLCLRNYLEYSEVITPPIYSYEFNRLEKEIDLFFNSTSAVLFATENIFSREQEIEQRQASDNSELQKHPTSDEVNETMEEINKNKKGIIDWFDLYAFDEFSRYLGDSLFAFKNRYSPIPFKHPIDLITLSDFFDYWNSKVSSCKNCQDSYEKSKRDVDEYYKSLGKRETQRRQRMYGLIDSIAIVIISVTLSTIVSLLI